MKKQLSALAIALATLPIAANKPLVSYSADNGDGTFTNPVLWADFPDPDIIRVDDTYYFVSTSMPLVPGATIMRSYDMVNWEFAANALPLSKTTTNILCSTARTDMPEDSGHQPCSITTASSICL